MESFRLVGERSILVEGGPKGPLDDIEVTMPASVTNKRVKNPFAKSLRFPGQG